MEARWYRLFRELFSKNIWVRMWEPLSFHTTIRIGGRAALFIFPSNVGSFKEALTVLKTADVSYRKLGAGSNTIAPDEDMETAVISLSGFTGLSTSGGNLVAEAGVPLFKVLNLCIEEGLSGLEFLSGIPGSVGGAVRMNAGAFERSVADVLEDVRVLDEDTGEIFTLRAEEAGFGYRRSIFFEKNWTVLSARFKLVNADSEAVRREIVNHLKKRLATQPLELPSAGSVFKRPVKDFYVGKAVEALGLKGYRIGDAAISEKHAGFIVNLGRATYGDVVSLVRLVKMKVRESYGVGLETEVEFWGERP